MLKNILRLNFIKINHTSTDIFGIQLYVHLSFVKIYHRLTDILDLKSAMDTVVLIFGIWELKSYGPISNIFLMGHY